MELFDHLFSAGLATAISVAGLSQVPKLVTQAPTPPSKNFDPPAQVFTTGGQQSAGKPKIFKITVSVRRPEDLKVQQGDLVQEGEVLADRTQEREKLFAQKSQLELSLAQINERKIIEPPGLLPVPEMLELPAPNFERETAEIAVAQLEVERAKRELELHRNALATEPIKETNDLEDANRLAAALEQKINGQELKLEEIEKLKDLPPSVLTHEKLVMQKLEEELKVAESDVNRKDSALQQTKLANASKTQDLEAGIKRAEGNLALAQSKLSEAQRKAAEEESRYSIEKARRIEERNQAEAYHSRHLAEVEQQKRDRDYQVAQITEKIQTIEDKINELATVTAPYTGTIRRIKTLGQNNGDISFELTLAVNQQSRESTNPAPGTESSSDGGDTDTPAANDE